ncbi:MAG: carbohydrate kinase family protein [Anaerolineae bacterium]
MIFVIGGGLRRDTIITQDGLVQSGMVGGNAVYAAVGAALWGADVRVWARAGANFPRHWLARLAKCGLGMDGIRFLPEEQDHRTFYAYTPDGRRDDTHPAAHFARINQPLPPELTDYIHSTPGQDEPDTFEPLALQPSDWPESFVGVTAVHLSPLALATHRHVPPYLRQKDIPLITLDPGERYLVPERRRLIRQMLPQVDAFLPSRQEVASLLDSYFEVDIAAEALIDLGAKLIVIKDGADGVWVRERGDGRLHHVPAFHTATNRRVKDVTGAGDAFCGGFLVGLAQSNDPVLAAQMGVVSASFVIEGYGAAYALQFSTTDVLSRLNTIQRKTADGPASGGLQVG